MLEPLHYEARMGAIYNKGRIWKHRTMRTVLDPYSSEWGKTTYSDKLAILERVVAANESLEELVYDYKERYREQNRIDIANSVEDALVKLMQYKLTEKK